MLVVISIVLGTFILCYSIAHFYLVNYLFEDKTELRTQYLKFDIFAFVFGLSNLLLVLLFLEIGDVDNTMYQNYLKELKVY
mgnify:CR=1 FL=1